MLIDLAAHWRHPHPAPETGPPTWLGGTIPQWLTVLAAIIAFVWTVYLYMRSIRDKRVESPRLVYVVPHSKPKTYDVGQQYSGAIARDTRGQDLRTAWDEDSPLVQISPEPDRGGVKVMQGAPVKVVIEAAVREIYRVVNDSPEVISNVWMSVTSSSELVDLRYTRTFVAEYIAPGAEKFVAILRRRDESASVLPEVRFIDGTGLSWAHRAGSPLRRLPSQGAPRNKRPGARGRRK